MFLKCYEKNNNDCQIYKKTNQFCKIYLRVDVIPGSLLLFFFKAFFFHFTSNSLFDFCCVILRFPLICFLPQLRKLGCFVREPKLAGTIWLVYYGVAPLLKNNPEKFHFGIKNPLDLWHLMRLAYLLRHTGLILYRI